MLLQQTIAQQQTFSLEKTKISKIHTFHEAL